MFIIVVDAYDPASSNIWSFAYLYVGFHQSEKCFILKESCAPVNILFLPNLITHNISRNACFDQKHFGFMHVF
jgi:hypothetical protein